MNKKQKKKFDNIKLRLADYHDYEYEEEEKQNDKKPEKKDRLKKPTKTEDREFGKLIDQEKMGVNRELFQELFNFQMLSEILKHAYSASTKRKIMIYWMWSKVDSVNYKVKIERYLKTRLKLKSSVKNLVLLKRFLNLTDKIKKEKD